VDVCLRLLLLVLFLAVGGSGCLSLLRCVLAGQLPQLAHGEGSSLFVKARGCRRGHDCSGRPGGGGRGGIGCGRPLALPPFGGRRGPSELVVFVVVVAVVVLISVVYGIGSAVVPVCVLVAEPEEVEFALDAAVDFFEL
jgi:hypothetical protein